MENIIKLSINKSLVEQEQPILNLMENYKKILLQSRMKTGKTHFTANNIKEYFNKKDIKVIFIAPVNLLITQFMERYKSKGWNAQNSNYKSSPNDMAVITTPDSLPKIIEYCNSYKKQYVLVIDEAHEVESSQGFRKSFSNIEKAIDNKLCFTSLFMSATPNNIIHSSASEFDRIIITDQNKEYSFKNGDTFKLKVLSNNSIVSIVNMIKELSQEYTQVFYKVDSHKKLDEITKILNKQGIRNHIYLSSINRDENIIAQTIQSDEIIKHDYKIIGFTSLINSGVEIKTSGNVCVVNFTNDTFNFINEIQMIGRFREGVKTYIVTIPNKEKDTDDNNNKDSYKVENIKEYKHFHKTYREQAERFITNLGECLKNDRDSYPLQKIKDMVYPIAGLEVNELTRELYIDKDSLHRESYNMYIKQYLKFPSLLLDKFKGSYTLEFKHYLLDDKEEKEIDSSTLKTIKEIKQEQKIEKEKFKEELKKNNEKMLKLDDDIILKILQWNPVGLTKEQKEIYNTWYELTDIDENIYDTLNELKNYELDLLTSFKIFATKSKSEINIIKKSYRMITLNKIYEDEKKGLKAVSKKNKEFLKFYKTREYIESRGFKNGDRITNKDIEHIALIFKTLKINKYVNNTFYQNKKLNTTLEKDVLSFLQLVCRISIEKNSTIHFSSVRRNLKDLINIDSID